MRSQLDISVVVAAYNEEAVISENLVRIVTALKSRKDLSWELVCVNDGSSDSTGELMSSFCEGEPGAKVVHNWRNFGQGRALRNGFKACSGRVIVTLDADLSYGPEYIHQLYDALEENKVEIALASPYTKGGEVKNVPHYRHFLSRYGNRYLARMSRYPISTITCVVRAYRAEALKELALTSDGMELQLEILMKASILEHRVVEIPARLEWAKRKSDEAKTKRVSKMRILRTIRMYLFMGWLSKPASLFIILALLMLLPGLYMALVLLYRIGGASLTHLNSGLLMAITMGFRETFAAYTYTVVFCGAFLLIGLNMFSYALIAMQNKFYFEESYKNRVSSNGQGGRAE